MIGGRASPASTAALRPTAPAFAVCVCRMCGRTSRISSTTRFHRQWVERGRDLAVEVLDVPDLDLRSSATKDIEPSPRASEPAPRVVS